MPQKRGGVASHKVEDIDAWLLTRRRRLRSPCIGSALGPRAGSIAAIASDPRGALLAELDRPDAGRIANPELLTSGAAARAAFEFQQAQRRRASRPNATAQQAAHGARRTRRDAQAEGADAAPPGPIPVPPCRSSSISPKPRRASTPRSRAEIGFAERLVWFWSNHFCVSADKASVRPICGAYEREAIRAHVLGRFGDMLLAVESHPAMLIYLDNARSIGPNSIAGINAQRRGLNENLAREILELHTLGVRSVYTQEDVTQLRQGDHRLDRDRRRARIRSAAASSTSIRACTSRARRR